MEIIQIPLAKMATFAYIAADRLSKTCALIDPAFETDKILGIVKEKNYRVTHLINTHCHSDHSAGNADIIARTGARLMIHRLDAKALKGFGNKLLTKILGGKKSPPPNRLLDDGDTINIGEKSLTVIHTPGHTPGGICLYCEGNLFAGDTLFVGSVGRTDLPGGSLNTLIASVKKKLYVLPGNTIVWPGHHYGATNYSTIEKEKRTNPFTR